MSRKIIKGFGDYSLAVCENVYEQMAEECGLELLRTARSHVWRSTLHTIARNKGIPIEMRAALFGHDPETARRYYTDTQDVSGVARAFMNQ